MVVGSDGDERLTIFNPQTNGVEYIERPVAGSAAQLSAGTRYWFVVTVLGMSQPLGAGNYAFARHLQNSDGLIDDGRFMYSNDPQGIWFDPTPGDAWAEMAFIVRH